VIGKAPCRVILTAPPADWRARTPSPAEPTPVPADEEQQTAPADGGPHPGTETLAHVDDRTDG